LVDVLDDTLQFGIDFVTRPTHELGVLRHFRPEVATPPALAATRTVSSLR
jgi:hypothetical protein